MYRILVRGYVYHQHSILSCHFTVGRIFNRGLFSREFYDKKKKIDRRTDQQPAIWEEKLRTPTTLKKRLHLNIETASERSKHLWHDYLTFPDLQKERLRFNFFLNLH